MNLVQEISNDTHTIELFTKSGLLEQGYNDITIIIKTSNEFVKNATFTWKPMMHMTEMSHSCPKSELVKVAGKETIYNGGIVINKANLKNKKLVKPLSPIDDYLKESNKVTMIKRGNYAWEASINNMLSERLSITIDGMQNIWCLYR